LTFDGSESPLGIREGSGKVPGWRLELVDHLVEFFGVDTRVAVVLLDHLEARRVWRQTKRGFAPAASSVEM
jgi:hypothetical protein